jgi:Prephenate dehydrogenase
MVKWVEKYHLYFKKDAIISDVCGVKGSIVYKIQDILKNKHEFVAAHPMAGKEVSGVKNADETIFLNANYIVIRTKNNTKKGIETAKDIGQLLGFKNISILSPKKHDEMIAFLSQLTHCLAISLMNCKASHHLKDYTGDSFKDLTRIAKINDALWSELFLANKEELLLQMDLFMNSFLKLKEYIEQENVASIKKMMKLSTKRRKYFD